MNKLNRTLIMISNKDTHEVRFKEIHSVLLPSQKIVSKLFNDEIEELILN